MRTVALMLCAIRASAWSANDYARHRYNRHDYQPIQSVTLQEQELPIAYQPALTEETEVETISDQAIWNILQEFNGLDHYTHAHHDSDLHNTQPTEQHDYPQEHHHYQHVKYNDRQPVVVNNQQRKIYQVNPKRYNANYASAHAKEELYAENIFFPTMKDDNLHSGRFGRAHQSNRESHFDKGQTGVVPNFGGGVCAESCMAAELARDSDCLRALNCT